MQDTTHILPPEQDSTCPPCRGTIIIRFQVPRNLTSFLLLSTALVPVLRTMVVSPTALLAAIVGLLLTSALSVLGTHHLLTNPVEASSGPPSYDTSSAANHFNLMPRLAVAGTGLALDRHATTSYHPRTGDPPYLSSHAPGECFGSTQ